VEHSQTPPEEEEETATLTSIRGNRELWSLRTAIQRKETAVYTEQEVRTIAVFALLAIVIGRNARSRAAFFTLAMFGGVMTFSALMNAIVPVLNKTLDRDAMGITALLAAFVLSMLLAVATLYASMRSKVPKEPSRNSGAWTAFAVTLIIVGAVANMYSAVLARVLMALGVCVFFGRQLMKRGAVILLAVLMSGCSGNGDSSLWAVVLLGVFALLRALSPGIVGAATGERSVDEDDGAHCTDCNAYSSKSCAKCSTPFCENCAKRTLNNQHMCAQCSGEAEVACPRCGYATTISHMEDVCPVCAGSEP